MRAGEAGEALELGRRRLQRIDLGGGEGIAGGLVPVGLALDLGKGEAHAAGALQPVRAGRLLQPAHQLPPPPELPKPPRALAVVVVAELPLPLLRHEEDDEEEEPPLRELLPQSSSALGRPWVRASRHSAEVVPYRVRPKAMPPPSRTSPMPVARRMTGG